MARCSRLARRRRAREEHICASAPSSPKAPAGRASLHQLAGEVDSATTGALKHQVLHGRHRRRRGRDDRPHPPRPARRHPLGQRRLRDHRAVDARHAHPRPLPDLARDLVRARPAAPHVRGRGASTTASPTSAKRSSARRSSSRARRSTISPSCTRTRFWIWDIDQMSRAILPAMGSHVVPLPIREALPRLRGRRASTASSAPAVAALAFQWSTAARYFTELAHRLRRRLPPDRPIAPSTRCRSHEQQAMRVAAATPRSRIEEVGRTQEDQLLHALFEQAGPQGRARRRGHARRLFESARAARERVATRLVSPSLIARVLGMLADFRSEHRARE